MTNYLAALALLALGAGTACADDKSAPARPMAQATARPAAAQPAASPASAAAPAAGAAVKRLTQKPNTGSLTFTFEQAGAANHGSFKQFETVLSYDEQNPAGSSLRVTVQMASLDTRDKDRDTSLASAELFDTLKFPTATYVAASLAKRANGGLEAVGKLTLRGVTRDLRIPITLESTADGYELTGETAIKRLDYGVGQGEWQSTEWVGNDVKLAYRVPLVAAGPAPPK